MTSRQGSTAGVTETGFRRVRAAAVALALSVVGGAACGDSTGPEVDWEIIEETTFAPSLGIDLETMNVTGTGVYWKDEVAGSGPPAIFGSTPTLTYVNWLTDGTQVDSGQLTFFMGNNRVMSGLEDGILNQKTGATRTLIIPPNRGYGGNAQTDSLGNVVIPGGSVLVFRIVMDTVQ